MKTQHTPNPKLVKTLIRLTVYALMVVSCYFLLDAVSSSHTVTIEFDWFKLLIAVSVLGLANIFCHLIPCKRGERK